MKNRRGFLALLGLAAPAAALARKLPAESLPVPSGAPPMPPLGPPMPQELLQPGPSMRYLGLTQLKNEGELTSFDSEDWRYEWKEDYLDYLARWNPLRE